MELRPFQRQAIDAIYNYYEKNQGNALISIATGCGKSYIMAQFLKEAIEKFPITRFIVATFAKELIQQNFNELIKLWPDAPAGILSAGLGGKSFHNQIIFAGIQTAYKHAFKINKCDILLIDESQAVPHSQDGMWRQFVRDLQRINPRMKVIGLSATPFRMDSGLLHRGPHALFTDVIFEYGLLEAIKDGYLCEVIPACTETHLMVAGVKKRGGEFVSGELERVVDVESVTRAAVRETVAIGNSRKSWLLLAAGIKHAEHIRDYIREYGISCEMVTSKTPSGVRDKTIEDFKMFTIRCLVVVGIGGVGFNHPGLDFIASFRPTGSAGLWLQQAGRGTRLFPGKLNCLLADYGKNTERHGPLDKIKGNDPKTKGNGDAPQKRCEKCWCYMHSSAKICPDCGELMPIHSIDSKLTPTASNAPILSSQTPQVWKEVKSWDLWPHNKVGAPTSLRVTYKTGAQEHSEWWCLEHSGFARDKAVRFWAQHNGALPPPTTVDEAIKRKKELTMPTEISVKRNGKYTEIVDRRL